MKCKFCNHTVNPTHKVCNKCGKLVHTPIHMSGWLWVIPILLTFVVLGVFTSKSDYTNAKEDSSLMPAGRSPIQIGEVFSSPKTPLTLTLTSGSFITGKDILPGRYIITTTKGIGNLFIYKEELPYINEVLTYPHNSDSTVGVTKIETNIDQGDLILISGLDSVTFSPAPIFQKTILLPGYHLVGRDVPVGDYTLVTPEGSGSFIIYDDTQHIRFNELLTMHSSLAPDTALKISLKEGEVVKISHLDIVELVP
ncbi:hypothetical protein [Cellulosilyticum sp. I15G10I2]|uniref:hypothetical protein n=1 Tax=Cellulosilyticum sp. I15G10I2 TaxID=1892843 RepID=UPI00085CAF81|nr:hypothetical protein [Cellulosilyticum sp. I15G10I2]